MCTLLYYALTLAAVRSDLFFVVIVTCFVVILFCRDPVLSRYGTVLDHYTLLKE